MPQSKYHGYYYQFTRNDVEIPVSSARLLSSSTASRLRLDRLSRRRPVNVHSETHFAAIECVDGRR